MLQIDTGFLLDVPLPDVHNSGPETKTVVDRIVSVVETETKTREELKAARTSVDKNRLQRRIGGLALDLDKAVYALYELPDGDIQIIEDELKRARITHGDAD